MLPMFIVLSTPRCGSTYLCDILNSHPDIVCYNEIFHPNEVPVFFPRLGNDDVIFRTEWRDANPVEFLTRVVQETRLNTPNIKLIGFKLLINDLQIACGLNPLLQFKPKVIMLHRRNKLAWYASLRIAEKTNVWVSEYKYSDQPRVYFDEDDFCRCLNDSEFREENVIARLHQSGLLTHDLCYLKLSNKPDMLAVMNFLGVSPANLHTKIFKQNTLNVLNRFVNPSVVIKFLKDNNKMEWLKPDKIHDNSLTFD